MTVFESWVTTSLKDASCFMLLQYTSHKQRLLYCHSDNPIDGEKCSGVSPRNSRRPQGLMCRKYQTTRTWRITCALPEEYPT